jgi:hypothetical protein
MPDLTRYSNIFGEPRKGVHSYRFLGIAIVDFALTVLAAYGISKIWNWNFMATLFGLIFIGIGIHGIFGVNTALNEWLGVSKKYN